MAKIFNLLIFFPQQCDLKYNNKVCGQNTLDKDNTKGGSTGGPETITIKEYADDGKYMVYVHQYSRSGSMCTARAKVTIYPGKILKPLKCESSKIYHQN